MEEELVLTAEQLKCLTSPACNDVVVALRTLEPASATEIASKLDRSPATVLYHLRRLLDCSLVREVGRRPTARKPEAVFALAARRFRLPEPKPGSPEEMYQHQAVLAGLRRVMRGYEKAASAAPSGERSLQVIRAQIRLTPEDTKRFLQMIESASQFAEENRAEEAPILHWSSILYPDAVATERKSGEE